MGMAQSVISPERTYAFRRPSPNGNGDGSQFPDLVGKSPAFRAALGLAKRVAEHFPTTVLIQGETGTGKELFARAIHKASPNAGEPFVAINCSAIPENLLESELFGHERGAFTDAKGVKRGLLEFAGRGTVLLDEVNELPMKLQPKLLRVLEERRVRRLGGVEEYGVACRIIAAANADLATAAARGSFREDLFYRLNVFRIELPPLRERNGDIDLITEHFFERLCHKEGLPRKIVSAEALELLRSHSWAGNVRELKNVVERMLILCEGEEIRPEHVMIQQRHTEQAAGAAAPPELGQGVIRVPGDGITLEEAEREIILQTLRITGGNRARAARLLGVSRPTVIRKIRGYGIERA